MRESRTTVTVSGIDVEVTRKAVGSLRLRVLPEGRVCVSAPWLTPRELIVGFVLKNLPWINIQLEKLTARPAIREHSYMTGETLLLWGREYRLRLCSSSRGGSMELRDGEAVLTMPLDSGADKREAAVFQWYRERLTEAVALRLPLWEAAAGLRCGSWQLKRMKTRWGSCNTRTGKLWFNLYLAQTPPDCLDYVLLHELSHLRYGDHGPDFKAQLDALMPDWRQRRKLLNSYEPRIL